MLLISSNQYQYLNNLKQGKHIRINSNDKAQIKIINELKQEELINNNKITNKGIRAINAFNTHINKEQTVDSKIASIILPIYAIIILLLLSLLFISNIKIKLVIVLVNIILILCTVLLRPIINKKLNKEYL